MLVYVVHKYLEQKYTNQGKSSIGEIKKAVVSKLCSVFNLL